MAYRWNLDYVTDVHGNAMAYYYSQARNAYAQDGNTPARCSYVRDSYLAHIDYGFTAGNAYTGERAGPGGVHHRGPVLCAGATATADRSTPANWLDVPYTRIIVRRGSCQVTGPTFWSTVRLASIATQQWNGTSRTSRWTRGRWPRVAPAGGRDQPDAVAGLDHPDGVGHRRRGSRR